MMVENDENLDKIKVLSSEDDKLKVLGELLSNKSSRDIIKLLIQRESYTNEIANMLDLRISLVIHHLNKMESIGLLGVTKRKITKRGNEHRFFRVMPSIVIFPNNPDQVTKEKTINRIFKNTVKFASIGVAAFIAHWILLPRQFQGAYENVTESVIPISVIPYIVIIVGLIILLIEKKKKGSS